MKRVTVACTCLLFISSLAGAQSPERKKAANQSRVITRSLARLVANGGGSLLSDKPDALAGLPKPAKEWLSAHRDVVFGAGPSPFARWTKWGTATTRGNKLFLQVSAWPENGKLTVPRLHNSIKSIEILGTTDQPKVSPNVKDWTITLPDVPKRKRGLLPVIAMELDAPPLIASDEPPTVKPDQPGQISLHSRYAIVHGEMLRFEPQPHKNTVGYWVRESDWAEWKCEVAETGRYEVTLRYGCGTGQGGSDIEIHVGEHTLPFKVAATGGFQAWRDVNLGTVTLKPGQPILVSAKPVKKAKNAVMDIQQITLRLSK